MKTMKIWRNVFMMLAAFSLASCSNDDDGNDVYEVAELGGTWQKVYDEGVADAGLVEYTFHPQSASNGTVDIFSSDWATSASCPFTRSHSSTFRKGSKALYTVPAASSLSSWPFI